MQKEELKPVIVGKLNQAEIDKLKKDNPNGIYAIEYNNRIAYFKNPNRAIIEAATKLATVDAPYDYFVSVMTDTFLGGDETIMTDECSMMHASEIVKEKVTFNQAKLVNL